MCIALAGASLCGFALGDLQAHRVPLGGALPPVLGEIHRVDAGLEGKEPSFL